MKMTVHQRLSAQRKAERTLAVWRRHRRHVQWFGEPEGIRCYDCCDVMVRAFECDTLWQHLDAEHERRELIAIRKQHMQDVCHPEPDDPKWYHFTHAMGYWGEA